MKTQLNVSVDTEILGEIQRLDLPKGELSRIVETALKQKLNKGLTEEDIVLSKNDALQELKIVVNQKAQLYPDRFKKCVRYAKYCGVASSTVDEKLAFWGKVLADMKKEISPAPPKEKAIS